MEPEAVAEVVVDMVRKAWEVVEGPAVVVGMVL